MRRWLAAAAILVPTVGLLALVTFALLTSSLPPGRAAASTLLLVLASLLVASIVLRRLARRARGGDRDAPQAPPAAEEAAAVPRGPVAACLRCGGMGMQPAPLGADALFAQWRCPRCGWRGQPLQFDRGSDYEEFLKEREQQT